MAKKFGSFVFLAALTGAVTGLISYLYKYQKFSEAVDQDFTDVVDSANEVKDSAKRSYTVLKASRTKEDFKAVAKDLGYAAKNLAVDAGKDAYKSVREAFEKKKTDFKDDEEAVDTEDVDVEFYYEDEPNKEEKEESSGLTVTEEL